MIQYVIGLPQYTGIIFTRSTFHKAWRVFTRPPNASYLRRSKVNRADGQSALGSGRPVTSVGRSVLAATPTHGPFPLLRRLGWGSADGRISWITSCVSVKISKFETCFFLFLPFVLLMFFFWKRNYGFLFSRSFTFLFAVCIFLAFRFAYQSISVCHFFQDWSSFFQVCQHKRCLCKVLSFPGAARSLVKIALCRARFSPTSYQPPPVPASPRSDDRVQHYRIIVVSRKY